LAAVPNPIHGVQGVNQIATSLMAPAGPLGQINYIQIPGTRVSLADATSQGPFVNGFLSNNAAIVTDLSSNSLEGTIPVPLPAPIDTGSFPGARAFFRKLLRRELPKVPLSTDEFNTMLFNYEHFGLHYDSRGYWLYKPESASRIKKYLGERRYAERPWGILELFVEDRVDNFLLFPDVEEGSYFGHKPQFLLDHSTLYAPKVDGPERPIVFFQDTTSPNLSATVQNQKAGTSQWVRAMRDLGHKIVFTNSLDSFQQTLRTYGGSIALVSSVQDTMLSAVQAYHMAKEVDPTIPVGLGGAGAIPEFAGLFDFVGVGEFYLGLPILIGALQSFRAEGRLVEADPIPWSDGIAEMDVSASDRQAADDLFQSRSYYPPVFRGPEAEEILRLSARRYLDVDGVRVGVEFPIAHDPMDGARLFLKTDSGIVAAGRGPDDGILNDAKMDWFSRETGMPFPISERVLHRESRPMLQHPEEFDRLSGARYPSNMDDRKRTPFLYPTMLANHGCRVDPASDRCTFCSIMTPAGKRAPSMGQIIKVMQEAVVDGKEIFTFQDDRFVASKKWVLEFVKRVSELGLHKKLKIRIQTRSDGISDSIMDLLRGRLSASFMLGVETLNPRRAENQVGLGKVREGRGEKYVTDSIHTLDQLASMPNGGSDAVFIIAVSPGDTIQDIAEDVYNQLTVIDRLWSKHNYLLQFRYNIAQLPYYGDRITSGLTGYSGAQPGMVPIEMSQRIALGQVEGNFVPFGPVDHEGALHKTGVFLPRDFRWSEPMRRFIQSFSVRENSGPSFMSPSMRDVATVGDMVYGLQYVLRTSTDLSDFERGSLDKRLKRISILHGHLKDSIGPGVMNRFDAISHREKERERLGRIPGTRNI
jgi:hypothetical protein